MNRPRIRDSRLIDKMNKHQPGANTAGRPLLTNPTSRANHCEMVQWEGNQACKLRRGNIDRLTARSRSNPPSEEPLKWTSGMPWAVFGLAKWIQKVFSANLKLSGTLNAHLRAASVMWQRISSSVQQPCVMHDGTSNCKGIVFCKYYY